MAKTFLFKGIKAAGALGVLFAASLLVTSCEKAGAGSGGEVAGKTGDQQDPAKDIPVPPGGGPSGDVGPVVPDVPPPALDGGCVGWDAIKLMVRTNPIDPVNERFLEDWRFEVVTIDDQGRPTSSVFYGDTDPSGNGVVILPRCMFAQPLIVNAYNEVLPPFDGDDFADDDDDSDDDDFDDNEEVDDGDEEDDVDRGDDEDLYCQSFQIFIPPNCYDQAVWMVGPVEDALWDYYGDAAEHRAYAWNPTQVDCGTWLANLQQLILTDRINDELEEMNDTRRMIFHEEALIEALQENQQLLVPTRPPICMAELRHNGGGMERAEDIEGFDEDGVIIDNSRFPWRLEEEVEGDDDPIYIGTNGIVETICDVELDGFLTINGANFTPTPGQSFYLDDQDFPGTVHDAIQFDGQPLDVTVYNVRMGDGYPLDHDKYDDACSLTSVVEFINTDDDEQDIHTGTGVTFPNLFGDDETRVWKTSDGDRDVDQNDTWAIFYNDDSLRGEETVIAVEFLGHREEDFRDVLQMFYDEETEDLQLNLRADYELNEEEVDGERAFLSYTVTIWDGSTEEDREHVRINIANCYEAADVWARQFFVTQDFDDHVDNCCIDDDCELDGTIGPLEAAEFAVRSQCFSNSRANQRWQNLDAGFWSINTIHGVAGNVVVNPGWLGPNLTVEVYIQKFDEAVFKGPRLLTTTDDIGQLMVAVPTLVEGDRVLIRAEDSCCSDYKIALPCVPEFTGFVGFPGIPYVPAVLGPPVDPALGAPILPGSGGAPVAGAPVLPGSGGAPVIP